MLCYAVQAAAAIAQLRGASLFDLQGLPQAELGIAYAYWMLCCAMLCYAVLCCAVLCYATLCYGVLCYVPQPLSVEYARRSTNHQTR